MTFIKINWIYIFDYLRNWAIWKRHRRKQESQDKTWKFLKNIRSSNNVRKIMNSSSSNYCEARTSHINKKSLLRSWYLFSFLRGVSWWNMCSVLRSKRLDHFLNFWARLRIEVNIFTSSTIRFGQLLESQDRLAKRCRAWKNGVIFDDFNSWHW